MNATKKQLSDSEIEQLRDDLAETEKRRWIMRLIRTGTAWIAGVVIASAAVMDAIMKLVDWGTRK